MQAIRQRAIVYTIIAAVLWSSAGLFIKWITLDAYSILFYRSLFAALTFLVLFRQEVFAVNKQMWISVCLYAPLLFSFVYSTKLTTAANAIFLQYTAPAIVLLLEPKLLGTKLTKLNIYTVIACMAGMVLFFVDQFSTPKSWLGIGLAAFGGLLLAGLIISQKANEVSLQRSAIFWGNLAVCVLMLPFIHDNPLPVGSNLTFLLVLGIGQLAGGYYFFIKGQEHLSAFESSIISMLEPILNPLWVIIGFGEIPSQWAAIGGGVIVSSLIIRLLIIEKQRRSNTISVDV
jgi:DME family drug/metabolite transporter